MLDSFESYPFASANNTNNVPSIGECLEILKMLPRLEYGSELHIIGIKLMGKQANKEIFVDLKDSNLQLSWLHSYIMSNVSRC